MLLTGSDRNGRGREKVREGKWEKKRIGRELEGEREEGKMEEREGNGRRREKEGKARGKGKK